GHSGWTAAGSSASLRAMSEVRQSAPQDTGLPRYRARRTLRVSAYTPFRRSSRMSPLKRSNNIAARMGRWSASHWKTAVFGWLAFVIASFAIGMQVGTKNMSNQDANVGESHRADQILKGSGFKADPQTEIVVIQSSKLGATDPAFRAVIRDENHAGHTLS